MLFFMRQIDKAVQISNDIMPKLRLFRQTNILQITESDDIDTFG